MCAKKSMFYLKNSKSDRTEISTILPLPGASERLAALIYMKVKKEYRRQIIA